MMLFTACIVTEHQFLCRELELYAFFQIIYLPLAQHSTNWPVVRAFDYASIFFI